MSGTFCEFGPALQVNDGCICITHYNEDGFGVIPKILDECPHHRGVHPVRTLRWCDSCGQQGVPQHTDVCVLCGELQVEPAPGPADDN